jgi:YD repeat-containing protein
MTKTRNAKGMTWSPGHPMEIKDQLIIGRWLGRGGGRHDLQHLQGAKKYSGDPAKAGMWINHFKRIYPDTCDYMILGLAMKVRHPEIKINHFQVWIGNQGIGKDTLLVPIRYAVGCWNFQEVSPSDIMDNFNPHIKSVYSSTGNRTVTGPLGIQETYKFTALQGVPKVTEIDRAANGTVAAATRLFTYDSNGYLKTATDWDGNQTAYTNNAHGLPTQIVYASGSADTHTTTIAYDTIWARLAKTITTPGVPTVNTYDSTSGMLTSRVLTDTTSQTVPYSTNGQSRTWSYSWTATGQLHTVRLPRTDVLPRTIYAYSGSKLASIVKSA